MQLTDVKCETCFSSPCSSEKPCVSHKCSHGKLGSFVPGLMLGVRKCGDDHHSHSVQSLTSWGTGLFISFQCLCSQSPCSSAFSLSCSLRASRWFLGRKEEAPTRNLAQPLVQQSRKWACWRGARCQQQTWNPSFPIPVLARGLSGDIPSALKKFMV